MLLLSQYYITEIKRMEKKKKNPYGRALALEPHLSVTLSSLSFYKIDSVIVLGFKAKIKNGCVPLGTTLAS